MAQQRHQYKLRNKYEGIMVALRGKARRLRGREREELLREIGFIDMKIREYGFHFYPTHYIRDEVRRLELLLRG